MQCSLQSSEFIVNVNSEQSTPLLSLSFINYSYPTVVKMWIEILLGLLGLLALFYWWLTTKWDFWTKQGIYQIKPVFPVGSVPAFFTKKEHLNDTFLRQAKETKGMPFYGLYLVGGPIFMVQVRSV